jgi:fructose/tagatose bisphosphate aldolase
MHKKQKTMNPTTPYTDLGLVNTKEMFQMAKGAGADIPNALHVDHGDSFELAKSCIDSSFSSVMLDGSHHPFDIKSKITRQAVAYAY